MAAKVINTTACWGKWGCHDLAVHIEQNGRHITDGWYFVHNILKCIVMREKFHILFQISLKFVPKDWINNKSALVYIMTWHSKSDKP